MLPVLRSRAGAPGLPRHGGAAGDQAPRRVEPSARGLAELVGALRCGYRPVHLRVGYRGREHHLQRHGPRRHHAGALSRAAGPDVGRRQGQPHG
ncbi:hypothetical protein PSCLAVI8L_100197 [Pseudoclavibacter sp. 8L]|nr:hypothetical protein PSCLAVI8L_100197 [Pseudoclavibacter sp. 8L]